ncbi:hypothetical protein, partial [Kingella kingae]|uniref:hypothetical protein n=1 Tax=Kingella kingae TaxID=504 RepID=UPI001FCB05EF
MQTNSLHTPYIVSPQCCWQGIAYTLCNGAIIRPDNLHAERIIYNGDTSQCPSLHRFRQPETSGKAKWRNMQQLTAVYCWHWAWR